MTSKPRTAIVYVSIHHKNTEKLAVALGSVFHADIMTVQEAKKSGLKGYSLIGFGSGIYEADFHKDILDLIETSKLENKKVFIFSTSGAKPRGILNNRFNRNIINSLQRKQAKIMGSFSCRGKDTAGPIVRFFGGANKKRPNKQDLNNAKKFAKEILRNI